MSKRIGILGSITLLGVIDSYEVDGVILGCTELPLILGDRDASLPLLNTVELHVAVALRYALDGG
jgi:aspartate racemase